MYLVLRGIGAASLHLDWCSEGSMTRIHSVADCGPCSCEYEGHDVGPLVAEVEVGLCTEPGCST